MVDLVSQTQDDGVDRPLPRHARGGAPGDGRAIGTSNAARSGTGAGHASGRLDKPQAERPGRDEPAVADRPRSQIRDGDPRARGHRPDDGRVSRRPSRDELAVAVAATSAVTPQVTASNAHACRSQSKTKSRLILF